MFWNISFTWHTCSTSFWLKLLLRGMEIWLSLLPDCPKTALQPKLWNHCTRNLGRATLVSWDYACVVGGRCPTTSWPPHTPHTSFPPPLTCSSSPPAPSFFSRQALSAIPSRYYLHASSTLRIFGICWFHHVSQFDPSVPSEPQQRNDNDLRSPALTFNWWKI